MRVHPRTILYVAVAAAFSIITTACGSLAATNTDSSSSITNQDGRLPVTESQPIVGTGGELIPIASDNVSAAGYDAAAQVMTVVFYSGAVYEYAPVESDLWQAFLAAQPHAWSAVGKPGLVDAGGPNRRIE